MAFALVGAVGAATQGPVNTAVTPAWGTGSSRTAGNLLLCFISITGTGAAQPGGGSLTGWNPMYNVTPGTSACAIVYYRIATGGDVAPTVLAQANCVIAAHLEEWSGQATVGHLDRGPGAGKFESSGITSPLVATATWTDVYNGGELVVVALADLRSTARASNDTFTSNHGTPTLQASNNGVSSVNHYAHATMIATTNATAHTMTATLSITTSITGLHMAAVCFKQDDGPRTGTGAGTGQAATAVGSGTVTATADMPWVSPYPPLLAQ